MEARKVATSPDAAAGAGAGANSSNATADAAGGGAGLGSPTSGGAADVSAGGGRNEIPLRLTLGGATLSMGSTGQWELEHSSLHEYVERSRVLTARNEQLEAENAQLRAKCTRMTEESNMEKFKCQLLVEMLALATLDEERSRSEAEQEKTRASSLKNDVVALLEQARKDGVDVRKLAGALTPAAASVSLDRP